MIELPKQRRVVWDDVDVDIVWCNSLRTYVPPTIKKIGSAGAHKLVDESEWYRLEGFTSWIESLWPFPIEIVSRYVGIWAEDNVDPNDSDYCIAFPHVHNSDFVTIALVVQVPEAGGEGFLMGKITPPEFGVGAIIGGREEHGVMRVFGPTPRISLIAQFDRAD